MSDRTGQQIGNYRLVRLLGHGGQADVYLGQNVFIHKQVAIKLLHAQLAQHEQTSFVNEAQTIERLKHPHIVQILDVGIVQGTPYITMDFAKQGTLRDKHPKGSVIPLATVIDYVKQIAEALQHAHDNKVIHRDLKPENVLIGANNTILLSDFGIAAVAHQTMSLLNNPYVGTAPYSAPEQINGQPRPESDQYALGIMIYEWLSGTRPFIGAPLGILSQHLNVAPRPIRQIVPSIPSTIEAVVMQALAKDPRQRFQNVRDFAVALEQACTQSLVQPGTLVCTYHEHSDRVYAVVWSPNSKYIASGGMDKTVQVWEAATGKHILTYTGHSDKVLSLAWSPNGKFIASGGRDNTVQVWEVATGKHVLTYTGHSEDELDIGEVAQRQLMRTLNQLPEDEEGVLAVVWSDDGKSIGSGSEHIMVHVWEAATGKHLRGYGNNMVFPVVWSPDYQLIASGSFGNTVLVSKPFREAEYAYSGHSDRVYAIAWSPESKYIASGSFDNTVQVWEAATGKHLLTYRGHWQPIRSIAWSPNGKFIASGSFDNTVQIWQAIP